MRKLLLSVSVFALLLLPSVLRAQFNYYSLSTSTSTYTSLTGASSANGTTPWDSTSIFSEPLGFTGFTIDTSATNFFNLQKGVYFSADTITRFALHGFLLMNANLIDRGTGSSTSLSPISFSTTGSAGFRIFKLEVANAGFAAEKATYGTLNDYINFQVWVYEGTNVVEIHIGSSQITASHVGTYWPITGGSPAIGFGKRKDTLGSGTEYIVSGPPYSYDSIVYNKHNPTYVGQGFFPGLPASGAVFTFTPTRLAVNNVAVKNAKVYPTTCSNEVMVDYFSSIPAQYEVVSVGGTTTGIKGNLINGTTHIDVSALAAGMYFVQVKNNTGNSTNKFIKL